MLLKLLLRRRRRRRRRRWRRRRWRRRRRRRRRIHEGGGAISSARCDILLKLGSKLKQVSVVLPLRRTSSRTGLEEKFGFTTSVIIVHESLTQSHGHRPQGLCEGNRPSWQVPSAC